MYIVDDYLNEPITIYQDIMSIHLIKALPSPEEIKAEFPLTKEQIELKKERDAQIRDVFTGASDKFLAIIGPCSADNEDAVLDYVTRLAKVQEKIKDKVIIIPRVYTNKPRTTGDGYKGMLHQPDPNELPDMLKGVVAIRELHIRALAETGFSCADEHKLAAQDGAHCRRRVGHGLLLWLGSSVHKADLGLPSLLSEIIAHEQQRSELVCAVGELRGCQPLAFYAAGDSAGAGVRQTDRRGVVLTDDELQVRRFMRKLQQTFVEAVALLIELLIFE